MLQTLLADGETINALGMREAAFRRGNRLRQTALARSLSASDRSGGFSSATRGLRMFLQSAMLGLGPYLVLREAAPAGAMLASSLLLGRGLAPNEPTVGQ